MCLAIFKPENKVCPKNHLKNGFAGNDDGAGFAIAKGGKIEIYKGFFTFEEFWKAFKPFQNFPAIIHFRYATHGSVGAGNCHPFPVGKNSAMIHNGILNIQSDETNSDTANFANLVLNPILQSGIDENCPALRFLVESSIGRGNKICLLNGSGECQLFNEDAGMWENGVWYSNTGYKVEKRPLFDFMPKSYSNTFSDSRSNYQTWDDAEFERQELIAEYELNGFTRKEAEHMASAI